VEKDSPPKRVTTFFMRVITSKMEEINEKKAGTI
jgi:hypothetical protein